jgi:hypothetical protein
MNSSRFYFLLYIIYREFQAVFNAFIINLETFHIINKMGANKLVCVPILYKAYEKSSPLLQCQSR